MDSAFYEIKGKLEIYDINKFQDWLFDELQNKDFVGSFDFDVEESTEVD